MLRQKPLSLTTRFAPLQASLSFAACAFAALAPFAATAAVTSVAAAVMAPAGATSDAAPVVSAAESPGGMAKAAAPVAPRIVLAEESHYLKHDPEVTWGRLGNGLLYAVLPHRDPPERVSVRLLVQAGSLMETEEQRGLAHFLEHMAFNGTKHYPPGELVDYLQRLGMGFGADTNAHTGMNETVYKLDMPHSDAQTLETGLRVMRDYADGILFLEEEINRERGVILSEKRAGDTVGYRSTVATYAFLFPESLLPRRMPIGEESVIANAPRSEFLDFYETWYRPERMAVVVVGDVDVAQTVAMLKQMFADLEPMAQGRALPDMGAITRPGLAVGSHHEAEATATEVSIVNIVPDKHPVVTAAIAEDRIREAVVNAILSRRLERRSQQPDAPFTSGVFYRYSYLKHFTLTGVELNCEAQQWEGALGVAEQTLRQALEHGFDTSEVEEAKAELLRAVATEVREKDTRKSAAISNAIVRSISAGEVFLAPQTRQQLVQAALKVKDFGASEALATLRQMWGDENRWVFVSGTAKIDEPQTRVRDVYLASRALEVPPPPSRAAIVWPYDNFGEAGKVVKRNDIEDLGITQTVFANNVRLNFKQTDFQKGRVDVNVSIAGGKLILPQSRPALALWGDFALIRGGLEALDWDAIQSRFAGKEVRIGFEVDEGGFDFRAATSAEDINEQLQLFAAYLLHPGYRAEGAQFAQREFAEQILATKNTLGGVVRSAGERFFAGGSYRFGLPDQAAFDAENMETLREWLAAPLSKGYLEISIVGDINYETAEKAVAATFGALPQREAQAPAYTQARDSVHFPRGVEQHTLRYAAPEDRALVQVAWPTADMSDIGKTRRLSLLASIVSDRLRLIVRQKLGEGYSPYAYNRSSDVYTGFGYLSAVNLLKPALAEEIAAVIRQIGDDIAKGPISEDEFKRALEPVLNHLKEYRRSNGYWLNMVLENSQSEPERLERARTLESDYTSITIAELEALAAEYLKTQSATTLFVLPRESAAAQGAEQ